MKRMKKKYYDVSVYLAKLTLDSLKEMFRGARDIMQWLADSASLIAKTGHAVKWTTPLGLPIVQPYTKGSVQSVETVVQTFWGTQHCDETVYPVSVVRQRSAFPPNFVHSLDSTHMMLTALAMAHHGLVYASVHDSFWTHAGSVTILNRLLREDFVKLHSQPLLENLRQSFESDFKIKLPLLPARGKLNLEKVKSSKYFFH